MIIRFNQPWENVFPTLRPRQFDLFIVDPPYGIGESGKNHKSRNRLINLKGDKRIRRIKSTDYLFSNWDNAIPSDVYFTDLQKISKNQIIFGANYFPFISGVDSFKPPRREMFDDFLRRFPKGFIIWDKVNGLSDFSDCEIIYTSFDFPSFVLPYMWAGMMQGHSIVNGKKMQGNEKLNQKRIHPTEKPIILYSYLLQMFSDYGSLIGDSHGGSEALSIACHKEKRDLIVMEKEIIIFQSASDRLDKYNIPYKVVS